MRRARPTTAARVTLVLGPAGLGLPSAGNRWRGDRCRNWFRRRRSSTSAHLPSSGARKQQSPATYRQFIGNLRRARPVRTFPAYRE